MALHKTIGQSGHEFDCEPGCVVPSSPKEEVGSDTMSSYAANRPAGLKLNLRSIGILIGAVTLAVSLTAAGVKIVRVWSFNEAKIATNEDSITTQSEAQRELADKVEKLAIEQAGTKSTVEAIRGQQQDDRQHLDTRLDQLMRALENR